MKMPDFMTITAPSGRVYHVELGRNEQMVQ
jgi:hypothetical protein